MLLSAIIFLPLLFALAVWLLPGSDRQVRFFTLAGAGLEFLLSLILLVRFDSSTAQLQFHERAEWIPEFGVSYFLGVDGISLWLVLLTTLLTPLLVLASWNSINKKVKMFHGCILALETAMLGTFLAMDSILFYVFWELSLIPMYFMVGVWGGPRRIYATIKFFIFTMAGSLFMLLAIIYLMFLTQSVFGEMSASIPGFYQLKIPFVGNTLMSPQTMLFFAFALAFAIKIPVFPLHTWLPDAHVEAPTPGSVILAGVMLKMGTYGFVRLVLPLFPEAVQNWGWLFFLIGIIGIIYGALVAMVQSDMKKLVAYSSVSHMGYIVLGLFAMNASGISGGIYQMLNHGISTGALFLLVGMIYERTHSREISKYGGLAASLPKFSTVFLIVTLSSIAVPMTNGFIGEYLILLGTYLASPGYAVFAVSGVVLGAVYMLWMYKKVFFGQPSEMVKNSNLSDLNLRESLVLAPLVVLIFWMGIFPNHFLDMTKASVDNLVNNSDHYELTLKNYQSETSDVALKRREPHGN